MTDLNRAPTLDDDIEDVIDTLNATDARLKEESATKTELSDAVSTLNEAIGTKASTTELSAVRNTAESAATAVSTKAEKNYVDGTFAPKERPAFTGGITLDGKDLGKWADIDPDKLGGVPVGMVAAFMLDTAPEGWIAMNGPVPAATYPNLAATVPARFVSGGQILLQDLRDEFIRGASSTRPVGTKEGDSLRSHTHTYANPLGAGVTPSNGPAKGWSDTNPTTTTGATGGDETRPRNVAYLWCIKAFGAVSNPGALDASKLATDLLEKLDKSGGRVTGAIINNAGNDVTELPAIGYVTFEGSSATISASKGVVSVTKTAVGYWTIKLASPMTSPRSYVISATGASGHSNGMFVEQNIWSSSVGEIFIAAYNPSNTSWDPTSITVVFY